MSSAYETAQLRYKLEQMQAQLDAVQRPRADAEAEQIAVAYARADAMAQRFGGRAAVTIAGESALAYRRRLLRGFLQYSPTMANADLAGCSSVALGAVEDRVYHDAAAASRDPARSGLEGKLIAHHEDDGSGRVITTFTGDPLAWMSPYMTSGRKGRFIRDELTRRR
jgi:hypothetical protein